MDNRTSPQLRQILAAIEELTPEQRRQLQRRLRVAGLLPPPELLTDRGRLSTAPALRRAPAKGAETSSKSARPSPSPRAMSTGTSAPVRELDEKRQQPNEPKLLRIEPNPAPAPRNREGDSAPYRSPVSGKVVVGPPSAPSNNDRIEDPHAMLPVPGQAPEKPIVLIFDGGSKGNPGRGYGSYALRWPGRDEQIVQLQFGDHVTNNEAEYDTLIAALETIIKKLHDGLAEPSSARINIFGDSLLVVNQVLGQWKCSDERMRTRRDRVLELLGRFGDWRISHHDRKQSVRILGH